VPTDDRERGGPPLVGEPNRTILLAVDESTVARVTSSLSATIAFDIQPSVSVSRL
jgi:hypothetical protein